MTEVEFILWGLTFIGVWTVLAVAGAACWCLWERYVGPTPKPQTCTRALPHQCGVNGPCNGWKKTS
jgi:hypothetical protein